jgi:outer membrane immunogenic protein
MEIAMKSVQMKKVLLGAVMAAISGVASAEAADMPIKAPAYKTPAAAEAAWTGGYVGVNGGYGWGHFNVLATPGDPNTQSVSQGQPNMPPLTASTGSEGWLGGIQAGYDWQFASRWVAGIETDFDGAGIKGAGSVPVTILFGNQAASFSASQRIEWFGTVRARIGYLATPDLLLYATGGFAYGKANDSATVVLPPGQANSVGNFGYAFSCGAPYGGPVCFAGDPSRISAGWTAGAGGEQRITTDLSVKLEYLHVDLGVGSYRMIGSLYAGTPYTPSFLNAGSRAAFNLVRAGLNYRF